METKTPPKLPIHPRFTFSLGRFTAKKGGDYMVRVVDAVGEMDMQSARVNQNEVAGVERHALLVGLKAMRSSASLHPERFAPEFEDTVAQAIESAHFWLVSEATNALLRDFKEMKQTSPTTVQSNYAVVGFRTHHLSVVAQVASVDGRITYACHTVPELWDTVEALRLRAEKVKLPARLEVPDHVAATWEPESVAAFRELCDGLSDDVKLRYAGGSWFETSDQRVDVRWNEGGTFYCGVRGGNYLDFTASPARTRAVLNLLVPRWPVIRGENFKTAVADYVKAHLNNPQDVEVAPDAAGLPWVVKVGDRAAYFREAADLAIVVGALDSLVIALCTDIP